MELELQAGDTIKITTNDEFKEKCTKDTLWLDYKNITKVGGAEDIHKIDKTKGLGLRIIFLKYK